MAKLNIQLTVDWEGQDFHSLKDLSLLRKRIGYEIPITHFICPSYFLKDSKAAKKIKTVVYPHDEVALHIHPLRELISYCKLSFRREKNFYQPNQSILPEFIVKKLPARLISMLNAGVSGRGVPITVYPPEELSVLVQKSADLLKDNLSTEPLYGFRAGGNMCNDTLIHVLANLGFRYDSSAFPPEVLSDGYQLTSEGNLKDNYGDKNGLFTDYVLKIWGKGIQKEYFLENQLLSESNPDPYISTESQPYKINQLWQVPINGGMSDFASPTKTFIPLTSSLVNKVTHSNKDYTLTFGFHQEGEVIYKEAIYHFIKYLKNEIKNRVHFTTISEAIPFTDVAF